MNLLPSEADLIQAVSTAYKFTGWTTATNRRFIGSVLRADRLELAPGTTLSLMSAAHQLAKFLVIAVRQLIVQGPECEIEYVYLVDNQQNESGSVLRRLNGTGYEAAPPKPSVSYEGVEGKPGTSGRGGESADCFDAPPLILIAETVVHVNKPNNQVHLVRIDVRGVQGGMGGRGQNGGDGGKGGKGRNASGFPRCNQGEDGRRGGPAGKGGDAGASMFGGRAGDLWFLGTPALQSTFNAMVKINDEGQDGPLVGKSPSGVNDNGQGHAGSPGEGGDWGRGHGFCTGGSQGPPGSPSTAGSARSHSRWTGYNPLLQVPAAVNIDIRNDVSMFL